MARNPRPCLCGHPQVWHAHRMSFCWEPGHVATNLRCRCPFYRPAKRTAPLRAKRQWAPSDRRIEIHVHVDPSAYTAEGKATLMRFLRDVRQAVA